MGSFDYVYRVQIDEITLEGFDMAENNVETMPEELLHLYNDGNIAEFAERFDALSVDEVCEFIDFMTEIDLNTLPEMMKAYYLHIYE